MQKYSISIAGHTTSVSLEPEFFDELKNIAQQRDISVNALVAEIDQNRETPNLSSAIRLHVLGHLKKSSP